MMQQSSRVLDKPKKVSTLLLLLVGYLFLLIFRPYEYWPVLGEWRIERIYMLFFMCAAFVSREKQFIPSLVNGIVVLFAFSLIFCGIFALSIDASWKTLEEYFKYIIFYFMAILSVRDERDFRFLLFSFVGVMFLYVGKSAWEFFLHGRYVWSMGIKRMVGIDTSYGAPNSFSASICFSLPLLWAMIQSKPKNVWVQRGLWAYGVLAIVAIISTGSRSGMFTALLFLGLVLMSSGRKFATILVIGVLLTLSWDFMSEDLQNRFLSTVMADVGPLSARTSAEGRMEGFRQGMRLFVSNPFLGIGPGNFALGWREGMNAHNLYGLVFGELGLAGVLSFGSLVVLMISINRTICKKTEMLSRQRAGVKKKPPLPKNIKPGVRSRLNFVPATRKERNQNSTDLFSVSDPLLMYSYVAQGIVFTLILMLFKGWGDHNLYRYTWLWLAALTVLGHHFFNQAVKRSEQA